MLSNYIVIFTISLLCIALELFFTRILSLKTWNHLVYLIIPFAILGYGIGANIYLVFSRRINQLPRTRVITSGLFLIGLLSLLSAYLLIHLKVQISSLTHIFSQVNSLGMLLAAYSTVVIPFIPIGFLVVYLFSQYPQESNKLYFVDLVGAGTGALCFVFLIHQLEVFRSVLLLSLAVFFLCLRLLSGPKGKVIQIFFVALSIITLSAMREPKDYWIDEDKGWERMFSQREYLSTHEMLVSQWHPLGRTDIYKILDPSLRQAMRKNAFFDISLDPPPEFAYMVTNFTAGTPIFNYESKGLEKHRSRLKLFSQAFEVPYAVGPREDVVVIGTGGGRDIFFAKTHGAKRITGAEINPSMHAQMSKGGRLHEYSGEIYTKDNVRVFNIDGRHLVKTLPSDAFDLIVLTGVDTFSGLSNGAYTYAESYLYTKNAFNDYLSILNDGGLINVNRRYFPEGAREDLRLLAIAMAALADQGARRPWEHIIIGGYQKWAVMLVKKTPFTPREVSTIKNYFDGHTTRLLFPTMVEEAAGNASGTVFDRYARAFRENRVKEFEKDYPYDISVITDNDPFFYKYYKFDIFKPFALEYDRHTGTLIFITQIVVLGQAILFIILFIFAPLFVFKTRDIKKLPSKAFWPFVIYFSCLGIGFMFIEIPLMQKFVLLLGSPIYSIAVTLTALLIFTGLGSYWLKETALRTPFLKKVTLSLLGFLAVFIMGGTPILDHFIKYPFFWRVLVVCLALFPFGILLGMFFPSGLKLVGRNHPETMAWAWGINCGLSVLGSILAIILAQFMGFHFVLICAAFIYAIGMTAFQRLEQSL